MPEEPQSVVLPEHIDAVRLGELAESDAGVFTHTEFYHLQTCTQCFNLWKQFIEDAEGKQN